VRDAASPVLGEASPSLLIQKEGDTVDMFCEATATPTPTLTWYKDGRELVSGDHVTIIGRRVRLHGLGPPDGGLYTCTFSNAVGSISHHIKLVIQGQFAGQFNRTIGDGCPLGRRNLREEQHLEVIGTILRVFGEWRQRFIR